MTYRELEAEGCIHLDDDVSDPEDSDDFVFIVCPECGEDMFQSKYITKTSPSGPIEPTEDWAGVYGTPTEDD